MVLLQNPRGLCSGLPTEASHKLHMASFPQNDPTDCLYLFRCLTISTSISDPSSIQYNGIPYFQPWPREQLNDDAAPLTSTFLSLW